MFTFYYLSVIIVVVNTVRSQNFDIYTALLGNKAVPLRVFNSEWYSYALGDKNYLSVETVDIKVYYECLCPGCINFDTQQFKNIIEKLGPYLNIHTYPYGNAETIEQNGKVTFKCQHGPAECYGNKLHACALFLISNATEALLFNSCMMEPEGETRGSNDPAAIKCGARMKFDVSPILECAKSEQGVHLLEYYGKESKKAKFNFVPYVLINGNLWNGDNFMKDVCAAFKNPPKACQQL